MKRHRFVAYSLLALIASTGAGASTPFLPGGVKMRGTHAEIRAACEPDATSGCPLVHLFETRSDDGMGGERPPFQLTAYPIAIAKIANLKRVGFAFEEWPISGEILRDGSDINYIFLPLTGAIDIVSYLFQTPSYLIVKGVTNAKFNRFLRSFRQKRIITVSWNAFVGLRDDLCADGFEYRKMRVAEENGIEHPPFWNSDDARLRELMEKYNRCGAPITL